MEKIINKIPSLRKLKKINSENELKKIAVDIRKIICLLGSKRPIHLSSNLGFVEISLAILKELKTKNNKIIYDIGHQCYVEKIFENKKSIKKIRTENGPSGFNENHFISGHSGNSLSAGLGLSYKNNGIVTIVIGDAGFINGQSLEALNNLFLTKQKIIIILNDNGMSISKTIKGLNKKNAGTFTSESFLGSLTKNYIGPIDGHNFKEILESIGKAKKMVEEGPVIIHCLTKKGCGDKLAEKDEIGSFHMNYQDENSFGVEAGKVICKWMKNDKDIFAINAAMTLGTGCREIQKKYPEKYFDVGIAEGHAMSFAVGLSLSGKKPICFYYSTFLQRSFDQLLNDAVNNNAYFLTMIDRADLSSGDGQTHHGIHDIGFLKNIPNSMIVSPRNYSQLEQLMDICSMESMHTFIRYPRSLFSNDLFLKERKSIVKGMWEHVVIKRKSKSCLVTYGPYIDVLARELKNENIDIINAIFINGYRENIDKILKKYKNIFVYERIINGHLVNDFYKRKKGDSGDIYEFNYKSIPGHGSLEYLDKKHEMDSKTIVKKIKNII